MVIVCDIQLCPYRSKNNFCRKRVVKINQNGVCNHLTQRNWREPVDRKFMQGYIPPKQDQVVQKIQMNEEQEVLPHDKVGSDGSQT